MNRKALLVALVALSAIAWAASEFLEGYGYYPPGDYQYVMVDQNGNIWPTNAVATVADAAATAAENIPFAMRVLYQNLRAKSAA